VTCICEVNQLPKSESYKTLVKPIMVMMYGVDEAKQNTFESFMLMYMVERL
jgi:hypothetical protein